MGVSSTSINLPKSGAESILSKVNMSNKEGFDEREEGEIIDEYEDIISSDEEFSLRKRIEELEAKNAELEKIENISANYGNAGFDYPKKDSYSSDRYPLISIDISDDEDYPPAPKMSRLPKRRKSTPHSSRHKLLQHSSSSHRHRKRSSSPPPAPHYRQSDKQLLSAFHSRISSHNSHTSKRKRKSKKAHSTKPSRKSREYYVSDSDNDYNLDGYNVGYLNQHLYSPDEDRHFPLNREELRTLVRSSHRNEMSVPLKDRLIRKKENTNTLNEKSKEEFPPSAAAAEVVEEEVEPSASRKPTSPTEEKADTEDDLEEQELRILALKSAVLRKHMVRKKRNENVAYSPSDFDEIYKCINDSPSLNNIEELEACNSMEISPVPSPKMILSDDGGIDTQPIDMDIVNSESDCELPAYEEWLPIDRIPLPNNIEISDELCVPTPMRYNNEQHFMSEKGFKPPEPRFETASVSPNNNDSEVDEEELALRALLLSKMNSPKVEKNIKKETRILVNANTPDSDISLEADVLRNFLINKMKKKTEVNNSSASVLKEAVRRLTGRNASSSPIDTPQPTETKPRIKTVDETEFELGETITGMARVKIDVDHKPTSIDLEASRALHSKEPTPAFGVIRVKSLKSLQMPQSPKRSAELVLSSKDVPKENVGEDFTNIKITPNLCTKQNTLEGKTLKTEKTLGDKEDGMVTTSQVKVLAAKLVPQGPVKAVSQKIHAKNPTKAKTNPHLSTKPATQGGNSNPLSVSEALPPVECHKNQNTHSKAKPSSVVEVIKVENACLSPKLDMTNKLGMPSEDQNKHLRSKTVLRSAVEAVSMQKNAVENIVLEKQASIAEGQKVVAKSKDKIQVSRDTISQKSDLEVTKSIEIEASPSTESEQFEKSDGKDVEDEKDNSLNTVIEDIPTEENQEKSVTNENPLNLKQQGNKILAKVMVSKGTEEAELLTKSTEETVLSTISPEEALLLTKTTAATEDVELEKGDKKEKLEGSSSEVPVEPESTAATNSKENVSFDSQDIAINDSMESENSVQETTDADCENLSSEPEKDIDKTLVPHQDEIAPQTKSPNLEVEDKMETSLKASQPLIETTSETEKLSKPISDSAEKNTPVHQNAKSKASNENVLNIKGKTSLAKAKPNISKVISGGPKNHTSEAQVAPQKAASKVSIQQPVANSTKIVKPNKIINQQSASFKRKPTDNQSKPPVPSKKIKPNETNRLITTAEIPKVPKLVIQLGASESESEYSAMSANEIDENEDSSGVRSIFNRSITIGNGYYDIASPISLTMESPCNTPTQTESPIVSRTQTPQPIVEKSIVNDYFEAKLEQFLKNVRSKVSDTKKSAEDQNQIPAQQIPPANCTPLAVRHLPESSQQEYRRLINRMKMLERQKQAKNLQVVLNTSAETLATDSRVSITSNDTKCLVRKVLVKNATAKSPNAPKSSTNVSKLPEKASGPLKSENSPTTLHDPAASKLSKENRLILYEGSYRKTGCSILANLDKSIELVSVAKEAKMAKLKHEKRLRELRDEMESVQRKLQEQQARITKVYPEIFNSHRAIESLKTRRLKINKAVTALGKSIIGPHYSMNNDQKHIISEKSRKLAAEIKLVNNMKIGDVEKWEKQNHLNSSEKTPISTQSPVEKLPAQSIVLNQNSTATELNNVTSVPSPSPNKNEEVPKCDSESPVNLNTSVPEDTQILECNVNATVVPETEDRKFYSTNGHEILQEALETEAAIGDTDGQAHKQTNMEDENGETDEQVGSAKLQDYVSPLSHLRGERQINPNGVVCPYQLMGQCDDKDCNYMHLDYADE